MVKFSIPAKEMDKYMPFVERSIELGIEFNFMEGICKRYVYSNAFLNDSDHCIVHYTLDGYRNLKKCMEEPTARRNSILNGIELILVSHLDKDPKTQELFEDYERDD